MSDIWKTRYDDMVETCALIIEERDKARTEVKRLRDEVSELMDRIGWTTAFFVEIRNAVGDVAGELPKEDLAERVWELRNERDEARKIAEGMFGVLDELGCGMEPLPWEVEE